jgi:predicted GIY-YIG superfamily endonuclease
MAMAMTPPPSLESPTLPPVGRAFCCYILGSDSAGWAGPYTGKTCDLKRRLHRHNHPSARSRAYTKGKGPWRVAAAVFGLRTNRQSVWLERALKHHAKRRAYACPVGLSAVQSAALAAIRVASRPSLWWVGSAPPPALCVHVFQRALQPTDAGADLLSESQFHSAATVYTRITTVCHMELDVVQPKTPDPADSLDPQNPHRKTSIKRSNPIQKPPPRHIFRVFKPHPHAHWIGVPSRGTATLEALLSY